MGDGAKAGDSPATISAATLITGHGAGHGTQSVCPVCLKRIPANYHRAGDDIVLAKTCPEHGGFETVVWRGQNPSFADWKSPKKPSSPLHCHTQSTGNCPRDCGLCPDHRQHTCTALIEITERCNLRCPVCFADAASGPAPDPDLSRISFLYDRVLEAGGRCNIQLSGGEPTMRSDLPEIIAMGRAKGFGFIQLNTNGLKLAEGPQYAVTLKNAGLASVFLQFDGISDEVHTVLRGRPLQGEKERAVAQSLDAGLGVVLVPTLVPGVNDGQIGEILRFALKSGPGVRGVHFQPVSHFGRHPFAPGDGERITLPEVMRALEEQSGGMVQVANFRPPGCEHALCSFHANYLRTEDGGLRRLSGEKKSCCTPEPIVAAEGARRSRAYTARQWGALEKTRLFLRLPAPDRRPEPVPGPGAHLEFQHLGHGLPGRPHPGPGPPHGLLHPRGRAGRTHRALLRLQPDLGLGPKPVPEGRGGRPVVNPPRPPLDAWIAARIGRPEQALDRKNLEAHQLARLRETLESAVVNSAFYAGHLSEAGMPEQAELADLGGLTALPFLTEEMLREQGPGMLCVGQDEVARIITMRTSGTTGNPKRLHYAESDLELTRDFFHHGMGTFTAPGQRVLILLPGTTPDSTGYLLCEALSRMGAEGLVHGLAPDPARALDAAIAARADVLVGFPIHVLAMARLAEDRGSRYAPSAVLLCSDYIPRAAVREIERIFHCPSYAHWGSVETGLGGGVECPARCGCHLREADLLVEVIDPDTARVLPDGQWGELVVTTLTRRAMPLIRYRTGDMGRIMPGGCPCGSVLKRLDAVRGRITNQAVLRNGHTLEMAALDEALLAVAGVLDFQAILGQDGARQTLRVRLATLPGREKAVLAPARTALDGLPELAASPGEDEGAVLDVSAAPWTETGLSPAKRTIATERNHS